VAGGFRGLLSGVGVRLRSLFRGERARLRGQPEETKAVVIRAVVQSISSGGRAVASFESLRTNGIVGESLTTNGMVGASLTTNGIVGREPQGERIQGNARTALA
jgi:hypothetical protein